MAIVQIEVYTSREDDDRVYAGVDDRFVITEAVKAGRFEIIEVKPDLES